MGKLVEKRKMISILGDFYIGRKLGYVKLYYFLLKKLKQTQKHCRFYSPFKIGVNAAKK